MKKKILLRDYQREGVSEGISMIASKDTKAGIVVLPTGSGKSLVAAQTMLRSMKIMGKKPLLLTHRKELIAQDEKAINSLDDTVRTGVVCSGLGRKEPDADIVLATIGSVYRNPGMLGKRDLVLIDEAHLTPRKANTMYGKVLNGHLKGAKRIGLTATPYRLDSGLLTGGKDALFDRVIIQITARELISKGYLTPLVGIGADAGKINTTGIRKRMGDFINRELEQVAMNEQIIQDASNEIIRLGKDRDCHLIFCVTVNHAQAVAAAMNERGWGTTAVWGNMPGKEREAAIGALGAGEIRAVTNVDVMTTGVDIPRLDCCSLMRPTMSKARHIQSLGRFMRLFDGKENSLVLDFAGNCKRHGDIDDMGMESFSDMEHDRKSKERKKRAREEQKKLNEFLNDRGLSHDTYADGVDPMSGGLVRELMVCGVSFSIKQSRRDYTRKDVIITYDTDEKPIRKWLCVEHDKARYYAERWFALRGIEKYNVPKSAIEAAKLARTLEKPESISVSTNAKGFDDILVEHFRESEDDDEDFD